MRYLVIALSGVADAPSVALGGRTPLEAARTPFLDEAARSGRLGTVDLCGSERHAGSDVALLALLGYDPSVTRLRRGSLEAHGAGVAFGPHDLVLRGNLVTLADERIVDLTAGRIRDEEARVLLEALGEEARDAGLRWAHLSRYRFLAIWPEGETARVETRPPHEAFERPVREIYPSGPDAAPLGRLLDRCRAVLRDHDVNRVRLDLGENPANFLWLWGGGVDDDLVPFERRFGLSGVVVAGAALARGVGRKAGLEVVAVDGATGDLDTDLRSKARAAQDALERAPFVFVHVQAANEASHLRDSRLKRDTIERADRELVGPLLEALRATNGPWRLLVTCDHPTATESEDRGARRSPFLLAGSDVQRVREWPFDEAHARRSDLHVEDGPSLMAYFLGRNPRAG